MTNLPAVIESEQSTAIDINRTVDEAAWSLLDASVSPATRRAYIGSDGNGGSFGVFRRWCESRGVMHMPATPETVANFLAAQMHDGKKAATIEKAVAAIRFVHIEAGEVSPTEHKAVKRSLKGVRRTIGTAPTKKKPATVEHVAAMLRHMPTDTLRGLRDRAMFLLAFSGAFRRSELVALQVGDLEFTDAGLVVTIRKSKTDQEGKGQQLAIPNGKNFRPVEAVRAWLDAAEIESGPVLRWVDRADRVSDAPLSGQTVADRMKRFAKLCGLDEAVYSGHSFRSGYITTASEAGVAAERIREVSRHKSMDVLQGYVQRANLFKDNPSDAFL